MSEHWIEWHRSYDDPSSSHSRRLESVGRERCAHSAAAAPLPTRLFEFVTPA